MQKRAVCLAKEHCLKVLILALCWEGSVSFRFTFALHQYASRHDNTILSCYIYWVSFIPYKPRLFYYWPLWQWLVVLTQILIWLVVKNMVLQTPFSCRASLCRLKLLRDGSWKYVCLFLTRHFWAVNHKNREWLGMDSIRLSHWAFQRFCWE